MLNRPDYDNFLDLVNELFVLQFFNRFVWRQKSSLELHPSVSLTSLLSACVDTEAKSKQLLVLTLEHRHMSKHRHVQQLERCFS